MNSTTSAGTSMARSRSTVHQSAASSPPKQPQRRSMPRSSACEMPATNTTSIPAATSAAARAHSPATSAAPTTSSMPTTPAATNGTKAAGRSR